MWAATVCVYVQVISERTKPRLHQYQSEVFVIIGGCTKDEKFVSEVTCLDPLRRSRLEVAKLPGTDAESECDTRKWVEFACVTFRNEVYLSGEKRKESVYKCNAAGGHCMCIVPPCVRW